MILVTSGLGFIGSHVCRLLVESGHQVVATTHSGRPPGGILFGRTDVIVAPLDVLNREEWDALGRRFTIDGVIHLAAARTGAGPLHDVAADLTGLAEAVRFTQRNEVGRVVYASSIGVYAGTEPPYREDAPLPTIAPHAVAASKKAMELAADLARNAGVDIVGARIAGAWGPLGNPASTFIGLARLVHAAAARVPLELATDVACDLIHVDDVAAAMTGLLTAQRLEHTTYNIGLGRVTTDEDIAQVLTDLEPGALVSIAPDATRSLVGPVNIDRVRADVGFEPQVDLREGLSAYIEWLRAGHAR